MFFKVIENFHLNTQKLLEITKLEKDIMNETGINEYTLQPIAHYGKLFTLDYCTNNEKINELNEYEIISTFNYKININLPKIVGVAEFLPSFTNRNHAHLFGFYVINEIRGKDIATLFLSTCENTLFNKYQIYTIDLTVSPNNKRAVNFYKKNGYEIIEFNQNYYGLNCERFIMLKKLK